MDVQYVGIAKMRVEVISNYIEIMEGRVVLLSAHIKDAKTLNASFLLAVTHSQRSKYELHITRCPRAPDRSVIKHASIISLAANLNRQPERILSPFTVLKRQKGNCFEYASLLVSYLIGANINAYVVFGYATREFTLGIFNRRTCPVQLPPPEPEPPPEIIEKKYKVNSAKDFRSKHLLNMEQKRKDKEAKALEDYLLKKEQRTQEIETPPHDDLYGWRVHAWVLVVPPSIKKQDDEGSEKSESKDGQDAAEEPDKKEQAEETQQVAHEIEEQETEHKEHADRESGDEGKEEGDKHSDSSDHKQATVADKQEDGEGEKEAVKGEEGGEEEEVEEEEEEEEEMDDNPFYIEPSTGFRYEIDQEEYLQVESIYNDNNYYVNLQNDRVPNTFNVNDRKSWLPFLPAFDNELAKKQFDMPSSWVEKLDLSNTEFYDRYPGGKKVIRYKKVILEKYAPYSTMDGLLKRYTTYSDYSYTNEILKHEWFDRRPDNLIEIHYDFDGRIITEYFKKGREDYLKEHRYSMDRIENCVVCDRELFFYHEPRFDHLQKITTTEITMNQDFINRDDMLYNRLVEFGEFFENQELHRYVLTVTEKYNRNSTIHASEDVAIKFYNVAISEILLQYHYEDNFVTKSTRTFFKPNLMDTGGVLSYDPDMTVGYVANPNSPYPRQLNLYYQLVQYMKEEEEALSNVRAAEKILGDVIYLRCLERKMSADAVLLFDVDKNEEARKGIHAKLEAQRQRKERQLRGDYSPRSAKMALRDYIDMMLKRQNRLQQEYERLVNKLKEDRLWYLTNQYTIKPREEAEYAARKEEMLFEVSTLEIRMDRQKELSTYRYQHLLEVANTKDPLAEEEPSERRVSHVEFNDEQRQSVSPRKSETPV